MKIKVFSALIITVVGLTGCLSRPALKKQMFLLASPAAKSVTPSNGPTLELRKVTISPQFDNLAFTYRSGEFLYDQDPYAAFLVPPAESLTGPLIARLQNTGMFRAVVGRDSPLHP